MIYSYPWGSCLSMFYSSLTSHKCSQYLLDQFHFLSQTYYFIQTVEQCINHFLMTYPIIESLGFFCFLWTFHKLLWDHQNQTHFLLTKTIKKLLIFSNLLISTHFQDKVLSVQYSSSMNHILLLLHQNSICFLFIIFSLSFLFGCEIHFFL